MMKITSIILTIGSLLFVGCQTPEPTPTVSAEQLRAALQTEKAKGAVSEEREKSGRFYSQRLSIGINEDREKRAVKDVVFDLDFGSESGLTSASGVQLDVNKSETLIIDDGTGNPIVMSVPVGFSLNMGNLGSASLDHVPSETSARAALATARGQSGTEVIGAIYKGYVEFVNAAGEVSIKRTQLVAGMVTRIVDSTGKLVQGVLQPITTTVKDGLEVVSKVAVEQPNGQVAVGNLLED